MSTTYLWTGADSPRRQHDADMTKIEVFPIAVSVVVRPGAAWWSWGKGEVWLGLRYGSNLCDVLQGDVLTVTVRGWISHLDELHGSQPRAAWADVAAHRVGAAS